MAQNAHPVDPALPDPISDRMLMVMIDVARRAQTAECTEAEAAFICQNMAPCLEELLDYRRRAAASLELVPDASNVVFLPRTD